MTSPIAFLAHASEDKDLARRIVISLADSGISTFFDKWEIRTGDSIRQKIDQGLSNCRHFLVLLTENSIAKPWVNAEIDGAFAQRWWDSASCCPSALTGRIRVFRPP